MADTTAVAIAGFALGFSIWQWINSQSSERLRFLLGEKETVGYQAVRIASRRHLPTSSSTVRVLMLAALFEGSDRARVQVYRALDTLASDPKHKRAMIGFREELIRTAAAYREALDLKNLWKRLDQLDKSLPWIVAGHPGPASRRSQSETKTCPDCAEGVKAKAKVCPHCGWRFAAAPPSAPE